jgi:4-amino-4-deoxy-L-arabinose transferase-like glycosyltransferase
MDNPIAASQKLKSILVQLFLAGLLFIVFLIPRLPGLDKFVTPDEPTWEKRSANFYSALLRHNYPNTYQTGHPGVTTMWLGALAYKLKFPEYENYDKPNTGDSWLFKVIEAHGPAPIELLATSRLLVALTVSLISVIGFLYARSLLGLLPALTGFALLAFDPLPISQARVLHTNALLGSFMILAVLAFMHFLEKRRWFSLVVSGISGGLGYITLSPGGFIVPAVVCLALLEYARAHWKTRDWNLRQFAAQTVVPLTVWGLLALLTIGVVWPAMWEEPIAILATTMRFAMGAAEGEIGTTQILGAYQQPDVDAARFFYYYPLTYLWRASPFALAGLVLLIIAWRTKALGGFSENTRRNLLWLLMFAAVYTIAMSSGEKKYDRYYLPAYPALDMLSGAGWAAGLLWLADRFKGLFKIRFAVISLALVIFFQAVSALQTYPYYLTYYNPLLGGIQKAPAVMIVGWGEGLNEAALYLKDIPGIENKTIHSWYPAAFSWFSRSYGFKAEFIDLSYEAEGEELANYLDADYVIAYINQWQRNTHPHLLAALAEQTPVHTVVIDGVEYVRIYKMR